MFLFLLNRNSHWLLFINNLIYSYFPDLKRYISSVFMLNGKIYAERKINNCFELWIFNRCLSSYVKESEIFLLDIERKTHIKQDVILGFPKNYNYDIFFWINSKLSSRQGCPIYPVKTRYSQYHSKSRNVNSKPLI